MQEWLRSIGFPQDIDLDGLMHRVSRQGRNDRSAWYIGWREPVTTVVAGDWRTGEKWRFNMRERRSYEEDQTMKAHIRAAMQEAAKERLRKQEIVAMKAEIVLRYAAKSGSHPYLARKRVADFGLSFVDNEILIPVKDISGKVWSYMRIFPDGAKLFLPGARVEGCFHTLEGSPGADNLPIYVAEGYATSATICMATDATVICAYHAGNLKEVSRLLKLRDPNAAIVICGDDDQWTPDNPGRSKATLAAAVVGGRVLFPRFKDLEGRPTDFNDLHCREGLDAVRRCIKESL